MIREAPPTNAMGARHQARELILHPHPVLQLKGSEMRDSLPAQLYPWERQATADRLWRVIQMIDRRASYPDLREAVTLTVREIEPFLAEYPKDRLINVQQVAAE